jgi:hypothetical protein
MNKLEDFARNFLEQQEKLETCSRHLLSERERLTALYFYIKGYLDHAADSIDEVHPLLLYTPGELYERVKKLVG